MITSQILTLLLWTAALALSSTIPLTSAIALEAPLNSTISPNDTNISPANPGRTKLFNETVYAEVLHMSILYPTASFVRVQVTSAIGPTVFPTDLTDVRLIFKMHGEDGFYTIFVQNNDYGGWASPQIVRQEPPPQGGVLPAALGMDILMADSLLKAAGYGQKYEAVDIGWPTNYPIARQQVFYFFLMEGDLPSLVGVGARDHEVIAEYSTAKEVFNTTGTETE